VEKCSHLQVSSGARKGCSPSSMGAPSQTVENEQILAVCQPKRICIFSIGSHLLG